MEFADILDRMERSAPGAESYGRSGGAAAPEFWRVLDTLSQGAAVGDSRAAYRANTGTGAVPDRPAARPEQPLSTDPEDIADELDLAACASLEELKSLRRVFARLNHPDRVAPSERERANTRMTLANAMIDEAARRFAR